MRIKGLSPQVDVHKLRYAKMGRFLPPSKM